MLLEGNNQWQGSVMKWSYSYHPEAGYFLIDVCSDQLRENKVNEAEREKEREHCLRVTQWPLNTSACVR